LLVLLNFSRIWGRGNRKEERNFLMLFCPKKEDKIGGLKKGDLVLLLG
jgi:hypothetical protein